MPEPLSFLVIVTDQLPGTAVGFAGDPNVATPNLDELAARSMVFDRTHVANPICMPNRASMITGRYPSNHGTRTNGIPLDPRSETVTRVLRRAGYRTGGGREAPPPALRNERGRHDLVAGRPARRGPVH